MKNVAAILLMGILFFNWYGYRLMSSWLESRADRQLQTRLDNDNYDEDHLVTIKIAANHLSYYNQSLEFEKVEGRVQVGGVQYKYVSRRLVDDSLELRCIPNTQAMDVQTARNDFFKLVNDIQQHNGQGKKAGHSEIAKTFPTIEYYSQASPSLIGALSFITLPTAADHAPALTSICFLAAEQPPDLHAFSC